MPLKLNVGLSRKIGEANYGSRGASVNIELELDSALVAEPGKLQDRIRQAFALIKTSLAEELNGNGNGNHGQPATGNGEDARSQPHANGNGAKGTNQRDSLPRPATQSQCKALFAITRAQGINLSQLLRERFRTGKPEELSIREASGLIDELKKSEKNGG